MLEGYGGLGVFFSWDMLYEDIAEVADGRTKRRGDDPEEEAWLR